MPSLVPAVRLLAVGALLAGCATAPRVTTSMKGTFEPARKRVFVWSTLDSTGDGATFGPEFAKGFTDRLAASLTACGAAVETYRETGLELDGQGFQAAVERADPDTVVNVQKLVGTVDPSGERLVSALLLVSVYGAPSAQETILEAQRRNSALQEIWRARARFTPVGTRQQAMERQAAELVDEVVNRMKADGFFPGCAPVAPPAPARAAPPPE